MKTIALVAAGVVAATVMTPVPAEAQRYGNGGYYGGYDGGYHDGYRRDWRRDRRWHGNRGWRGDRRWGGRGYVRCHYVRGYYGRQRQCYRAYR